MIYRYINYISILAGLPGVARAFTTAQPLHASPSRLPAFSLPAPTALSPPAGAPHNLNISTACPFLISPRPLAGAPLAILTPPRPVPGPPRPTCKVSALYLENCANASRQTETDKQTKTDRQSSL